ncbi:transcription factor bHLH112-like [Oryza glaberrima]|uniref:BHLH domain-containing protein n=1 Tax=Oryza glaberrima TaxID=4538 RepID=I1PPL8_ORYGL|nr:transcription factor bHLH112-like [Oryza glaberrima]
MGDHQMMHAAPAAMYNGGGGGGTTSSHGVWWSNAVGVPAAATCSTTTELAGYTVWSSALAAGYDGMVADNGGKQAKSTTTASSESPGNNSSVTFQEPASIPDPAAVAAVPQPGLAGFTDWTQPFMNNGAGLHEFLQDGHHDMSASSLMNHSSNNLALQQAGHHHELLSSFGSDLLLSPTSPYGGFQSSLLRSLMEPTAKQQQQQPALAGLQQYHQYQQQMGHTPAAAAKFAQAVGARDSLQFTNDAPFWNPSAGFGMPAAVAVAAAAAQDQASVRSAKRSSPAPPRAAATLALKTAMEGVGDSSSVITKKETAFKKPRLETPSPLPTFKVRKEKLGDRITALQQLVSPFGKTDTASVLHETIEYIKFLHDQVGALSAPYLKNGAHQLPHLKNSSPDKSKHGEISLKGRGLCLVPISSTFAVASEVPVELWTPFGANFIR